MSCPSLEIASRLYALLAASSDELDGAEDNFTDQRRWNSPPTPQNETLPKVQHLFSSKRLAYARILHQAHNFMGLNEGDLEPKESYHDAGPFLTLVNISCEEGADVFTPTSLRDFGIPNYPAQADNKQTRATCKSIGDGLFGSSHDVVVVRPSEPEVLADEEILVNVSKMAISANGDALPWSKWFGQAEI